MALYEIAILYHPSLEVGFGKAEEQIQKIFTNNKAKVVNTDNWGKRKLAYPIKKQDYAIYVFYSVEIDPESVRKIEGSLNITDEIIRYLITKPDIKAEQAAEKERAKKEADEAKRGESQESSSEEVSDQEEE